MVVRFRTACMMATALPPCAEDRLGSRSAGCYNPLVPEFLLFGPFEVRDEAGEVVPIRRQKQRALAAALALRPSRPVSAERLVDDLWDDPPRKAKEALQNYVSQLRKLLGPDIVSTGPAGYVLEVEPEQVDVFRFERLVADARDAVGVDREAKLREALSLVRGSPLADLALEPFAPPEVTRLEELEVGAREQLVDAELELGWHAEAIPELERLVSRYPYRERLRAQLMLALYRSGRQADALDAYRRARAVFVDELGIDPGEDLQRLEAAILRHDESLRAPRRQRRPEQERLAPSTPRPARKIVTVVFATLLGRTPGVEEADPEIQHESLRRHVAVAREAVEAHGGVLERTLGSELVAVFGLPAAHEDDALRAVRAAVEMRRGIEALASGLALRAGVGTGAAFVAADAGPVTGPAVTTAEALEHAARVQDILLSSSTRRLVGDAVVCDVLDADEQREAFRVLDLVPENFGRRLHLDSPMVGRSRELEALVGAYERVVHDRTCHLFTVLGEAGIGKSRLARELAEALPGACVLRGRCPSYGEGITFQPLLEIARQAAKVSVPASDRAVTVERLAAAGSLPDISAAAAAMLSEIAGDLPLIVLLDDLQWAEQAFLDIVGGLADTVRATPVLLLCLARPELLEGRPEWGGGKANASTMLLEPLTEEESEQLLDNLLGESDVPAPVRAHIVGGAEGNPLFVEELLEMLVERELLRREGGRWTTTKLAVPRIPPSIQALLAARIDRLPEDERIALELASLEGNVFHRQAVAELLPKSGSGEPDVLLTALVRKELLRPVELGEMYRFRHQLIRDAAYESMPKRLRAELHEHFARWLARQPAARDTDEVVGYHLESAYRYRVDLEEADDAARALAAHAAEHLTAAGNRASVRGDTVAAASLLARASALTGD